MVSRVDWIAGSLEIYVGFMNTPAQGTIQEHILFPGVALSVSSTFSLTPACLRLLPAGPFLACPLSQAVEDTLLVMNCSNEVVFLFPLLY